MIADALALAAEPLGDDAAPVLSRIRGLDAGAGRPREEVLAATRAPTPPSLRGVHATWIEHVLAPLPVRARTAVSECTDEVDVWLARWVTFAVPPSLPARDSLAWLMRVGADQFAFALGEQARAVPALGDAIARIDQPPRAGQLGPKRAAIARCRDVSLDDDLAFVRVACRALAPHLWANQLGVLQLILTLPRPIGIVVARELALHARASIDQCPSWAALDAR